MCNIISLIDSTIIYLLNGSIDLTSIYLTETRLDNVQYDLSDIGKFDLTSCV